MCSARPRITPVLHTRPEHHQEAGGTRLAQADGLSVRTTAQKARRLSQIPGGRLAPVRVYIYTVGRKGVCVCVCGIRTHTRCRERASMAICLLSGRGDRRHAVAAPAIVTARSAGLCLSGDCAATAGVTTAAAQPSRSLSAFVSLKLCALSGSPQVSARACCARRRRLCGRRWRFGSVSRWAAASSLLAGCLRV